MRCAVILHMQARLGFSCIFPIFSLPWAKCTLVNMTVKFEGDRAKRDKSKCTVANALLEEALSIQRAHTQYGLAAQTLTLLVSSHGNLEMFDEARSTLKEAITLSSRCDGKESTTVASCHN